MSGANADQPRHRSALKSRREALNVIWGASVALLSGALPMTAVAAVQVAGARVWPAEEYTRVTFEAASGLRHELLSLKDPERLVLDLMDVDLNDNLRALPAKISADDPYIRGVRIGRFKPDVLRVVFDLKTEVKASAFALPPVASYGHRLVLDIYPATPRDPMMAMLDRGDAGGSTAAPNMAADVPRDEPDKAVASDRPDPIAEAPRASAADGGTRRVPRPASGRTLVIAVDAGHGGEDPGG